MGRRLAESYSKVLLLMLLHTVAKLKKGERPDE